MLIEVLRVAMALLVLALLVRGAAAFAHGLVSRLSRARRFHRAARGERDAVRLLEHAGFVIEADQATARWHPIVGREVLDVDLRADFVVRRGRARYVAEVKTGEAAPSPSNPATRRQLLEYRCAFAVDGVLLVRPESGRIDEVEFPLPTTRTRHWSWVALAAALAAGAWMGHSLHP